MTTLFGILGAAVLFAFFGYMTIRQGCGAEDCGSCTGDSCSLPHGEEAESKSSKASGWWPQVG